MIDEDLTLLHAPHPYRVAIIGVGRVGATLAYTLLLKGAVGEIVLIDLDKDRAEGEAMDLGHAAPFSNPVRVWAGDYPDCAGAEIVIICAGVAQREGETRLDLVRRNAEVFKNVVPKITEYNKTGILIVATNPVDILSFVTWKLSGFPARRVIGSGTVLDTARFRYLLGNHLGVDPRNVHGYIIGEHGDSEVPVWSRTTVAGIPLDEFQMQPTCDCPTEIRQRIFRSTRDAAYEIIKRKGATYYAVAAALTRIVESILSDQRSVLSVSTLVPTCYSLGELYLSLPTVVGKNGVERVLEMPLTEQEAQGLRNSARLLREVLSKLGY